MSWAPDYIDADDLADFVRIGDSVDDVWLAHAATAASRAVDAHCHRQFGVAAQERTYNLVRYDYVRGVYVVDTDDLSTDDGLVVTVDGETTTDYTLEPLNAPQNGRPYTRIVVATSFDSMAASGMWGWSAVPDPVIQASLLQGSRIFARRGAPFGVAGSPDQGSEIRLLSKVDPDVAVILRPFRRVGGLG